MCPFQSLKKILRMETQGTVSRNRTVLKQIHATSAYAVNDEARTQGLSLNFVLLQKNINKRLFDLCARRGMNFGF